MKLAPSIGLMLIGSALVAAPSSNVFQFWWPVPTNQFGPDVVDAYTMYSTTQLNVGPTIWRPWTNFASTNLMVTNVIAVPGDNNYFFMVTASNINGEGVPSNAVILGAPLGTNTLPLKVSKTQ